VILWRVSNHNTLDGVGGLRAPGRWHSRGHRIAYCAPNPASALIEVLVHSEIDIDDIPLTFRYMEIEAGDEMSSEAVEVDGLGENWSDDLAKTRGIGDEWLLSGRTALLQVPSAIVPATWNTLLNPLHPDAVKVKIVRIHELAIDPRLVQ
jgi:RES domain-containing protein